MKSAFWIPSPTTITAPTRYALELADAKQQLNLIGSADDDLLLVDLIKAAHEYIETATDLTLTTTSYRVVLRVLPESSELVLPKPPVSAVSSFSYYDENNASQTFTDYYLRTDGNSHSRILLNRDASWPNLYDRWDAVTIDYTAGIGANAAAMPATVRHAMRLLVAHWYDNRESVLVGSISKNLEHSLNGLLGQLRSGRLGGMPWPV